MPVFSCNAGYAYVRADGHHAVDDECIPCFPGKYKNQVGNSGCTDCPAGTYGPTPALSSVKDCKVCGTYRVSPSGSIAEKACICAAGYGVKGGTNDCSACQPGTYKDTEGNSNCINCSTNTYGEAIAATTVDYCKTCGLGSYSPSGSIKETDCICDFDFRHLDHGSTWTCVMHLAILIMVVLSFVLILITCCIVMCLYFSRSRKKDLYQPLPKEYKEYRTVWSQTPPFETLTTPIPMPTELSQYFEADEMVAGTRSLTPRMMPVYPVQYEPPSTFRQLGCVAVCVCFYVCARVCV
jgi:hypothetical protein